MVGPFEGRGQRASIYGIAILVVIIIAFSASFGEAPTVRLETIQQVWRARQEQVHTARLSWKEQITQPCGSISAHMPRIVRHRLQLTGKEIIPPEDKTLDFSLTLELDDGKARFSYEGMEWAGDNADHYRSIKYASVFDGTECKDLYPDGLGNVSRPQGGIRAETRFRDAQLYRLRPLLLAYRSLDPSLRPFDLQGFSACAERKNIGGRLCIELEKRVPPLDAFLRLWVDPERDFVVLRHTIEENGEVRVKMDIDYRQDVSAGWVPTHWAIVSNGPDGRIIDSTRGSMITTEFNGKTDATLFALVFPTGTMVVDEKNGGSTIYMSAVGRKPLWKFLPLLFGAFALALLIWRRWPLLKREK